MNIVPLYFVRVNALSNLTSYGNICQTSVCLVELVFPTEEVLVVRRPRAKGVKEGVKANKEGGERE
jgi:hypothetical protein